MRDTLWKQRTLNDKTLSFLKRGPSWRPSLANRLTKPNNPCRKSMRDTSKNIDLINGNMKDVCFLIISILRLDTKTIEASL